MLAWDIETMGLDSAVDLITVAAVYDADTGINRVFRFVHNPDASPGGVRYHDDARDTIEEFLCMLDTADSLTTFNGVQFDIPFVQVQFNVPEPRVRAWLLKTYDIFEFCRRVFDRSFGLNVLLKLNGFDVKSGTGTQAIVYAQQAKWFELESYCADDAKLTWDVAQKSSVVIPEAVSFRKRTGHDYDPMNFLTLHVDHSQRDAPRFSHVFGNNLFCGDGEGVAAG
jgi:hypothetical protein